MNKPQLLALYDQDQRIDIVYPGIRREVFPGLIRHTNISGYGEGMVLYSRLDEKAVDEVIEAQIEYFKSIDQDFEWKVYSHDRPLDLRERLAARGFEVEDAEAIMVLDLAEAPARLLQPVSHVIKKIIDPGGVEDVVMIESTVWGVDFSDMGRYLADTLETHPEQLSIYIACIDEKPATGMGVITASDPPAMMASA